MEHGVLGTAVGEGTVRYMFRVLGVLSTGKKIEREMEKKKRGGKEQSKGSVKNKNVAC